MEPNREKAEAVETAAARWLARHDAGALDEAEARDFETWCAGDPRRLGAFVRLQAVSARLDRAGALPGLAARPAPRRGWAALAAAGVAAALLLAGWPAMQLLAPDVQNRQISTALGEQYRSALKDGSLVELNTSTQLAVRLRPRLREIRLKTGEAVFQVAHDRTRPFVVRTDYGDVRAVGTAFSVNTLDGLEVAVTEGVVAVERDHRELARVAAGETLTVTRSGDVVRRGGQAEEIRRSLAWRQGNIDLAGETLGQAVADFNRYNRVRLRAEGPAADLRVGGYFRATDPEGFASALERSLPVAARQSDGVITLSMRRPAR